MHTNIKLKHHNLTGKIAVYGNLMKPLEMLCGQGMDTFRHNGKPREQMDKQALSGSHIQM